MKTILAIIILTLTVPVFAENTADTLSTIKNDIIVQKYERKNAHLAMTLSALFPGAGQFYTNKSSWRKYIYPIIEIAAIGGALYFNSKGDDKTSEYKKYADQHYDRIIQYEVEGILININNEDKYTDEFFDLDSENSQHFYEDIGKYNKYIFGWEDWIDNCYPVDDESFKFDTSPDDPGHIWIGTYHSGSHQTYSMASEMRAQYQKMRNDAEEEYDKMQLCTFAVMFNHVISSIDAFIMTKRYNQNYLKTNKYGVKIRPTLNNDGVGAIALFEKRF